MGYDNGAPRTVFCSLRVLTRGTHPLAPPRFLAFRFCRIDLSLAWSWGVNCGVLSKTCLEFMQNTVPGDLV